MQVAFSYDVIFCRLDALLLPCYSVAALPCVLNVGLSNEFTCPNCLISGLQILHEKIHLDKQSLITPPFGSAPSILYLLSFSPQKDWRRLRFAQMLTRHLVGT